MVVPVSSGYTYHKLRDLAAPKRPKSDTEDFQSGQVLFSRKSTSQLIQVARRWLANSGWGVYHSRIAKCFLERYFGACIFLDYIIMVYWLLAMRTYYIALADCTFCRQQ